MTAGGAFSRRGFFNWLLNVSGLATLGSIVFPVVKFLIPPETAESTESSVVAGTVDELPVNGWKIFKFGTRPGILIRKKEGEFIAFSAKCTHLDCIVQYKGENRMIWCACHNGHYDLTGKNISGPPPRPLEVYKANILGDKVIVTRA
jgi:Rieske Fe-S protein